MQTDYIITYGLLVHESLQEYINIINSKRCEPTDIKNISKDGYLLLTAYAVAIESPVNKTVEKVYCKIRDKGKDNNSEIGSSTKLDVTCYNCGKKGQCKKGIANPIEMVLMGNHPRHQQENFQNGSPKSLLFQMYNI